MFRVEFSSQARKFLKKADANLARRIVERIERLSEDPFPSDVKRIVNRTEKIFRVRVGDYHILYCVIYEQNILFISEVDKRESIY